MLRRTAILLATTAALFTLTTGIAHADSAPPTNGGNGGGQSGQCTGNPDDLPTVCPATP
jgi:hypothetical protein